MHIDAPTLSAVEQRNHWGVGFPRDPAAVIAEREWEAARFARSNGARPQLTADEALALSHELATEAFARRPEPSVAAEILIHQGHVRTPDGWVRTLGNKWVRA